ncbi:MAG TPA: hypothetical protein VIJ22_19845, partial [Polyangiaceae bacterium]
MRLPGQFALLGLATAATCGCSPRARPVPDEVPGIAELQSPFHVDPAPLPVRPSCQDAGWTTYAHDPARTSASSGCLFAPLRAGWSFSPRWVKGTPSHATRAVVAGDAVYVSGGIGPTPTVWRLGVGTGDIRWTYI